MKKDLLFVILLLSLWFLGCGQGQVWGSETVCDVLVSCEEMTPEECQEFFASLVLPDGCIDAIKELSCEDLKQDSPSFMDLCFPSCIGSDTSCLEDEITFCRRGRTFTQKCEVACEELRPDLRYTGVCGKEYLGMGSRFGGDVCWCE